MSDPFQNHASGLDAPASSAFAITPGSSDLAVFTRCIYVGTSGDLELTMIDGSTATIKNAAVGYHPLRVKKVTSGTTASDIVGLV